MAWLTILGVLVVIGYYIVLTRRSKRVDVAPSEPSSEIKHLSIEQARDKVDELIARKDKLFVAANGETSSLVSQLGPTTREFFSRYGTLTSQRGGFRLAMAEVKSSEYMRGYLSIGNSEDWDVIQKPGNDEVLVVEGAETSETETDARFPSVYHLVLDEALR